MSDMYVIDFSCQLYVPFWKRQYLKGRCIHGWNFKNKNIYGWGEASETKIPYNLGKILNHRYGVACTM